MNAIMPYHWPTAEDVVKDAAIREIHALKPQMRFLAKTASKSLRAAKAVLASADHFRLIDEIVKQAPIIAGVSMSEKEFRDSIIRNIVSTSHLESEIVRRLEAAFPENYVYVTVEPVIDKISAEARELIRGLGGFISAVGDMVSVDIEDAWNDEELDYDKCYVFDFPAPDSVCDH